jgi:hypothetical protein
MRRIAASRKLSMLAVLVVVLVDFLSIKTGVSTSGGQEVLISVLCGMASSKTNSCSNDRDIGKV